MAHEMALIKETADAHLRRDMQANGKWTCMCEACAGMRSLTGLDKILEVRPLVREIQLVEAQLQNLPEGPERQALLDRCYAMHDKLAEVMAR